MAEIWRVLRRGPVRAGLAACLVAVLAAYLVGSGRQPTQEVLAASADLPDTSAPATPPSSGPPVRLPEPSSRQVHQPASVSGPPVQVVSAGATGIPDVALAAYQRSAVVIDAADPSCSLDWALLAAIGQVESDHGQYGGSHLNSQGVDHPGIVGPRLDGRHGTSKVLDTDAGRLDGDRTFDRAVGPMQFLPSTWAAVAVDGDSDGRRDVQDINDASLGSAVYLCADHDDLSTKAGQRSALLRYNHSSEYAARVMAIAAQLRTSSVLIGANPIAVDQVFQVGDLDLRGPEGPRTRHEHDGDKPSSQENPPSDPNGPIVS